MYKLYYTYHNMWSSHLLQYRYDSPWPRTELPEAYIVWEHRTFWLKQLCCPQDVIPLPRCYTSFQDVPTTFPRRDIRHAHKNFQASAWGLNGMKEQCWKADHIQRSLIILIFTLPPRKAAHRFIYFCLCWGWDPSLTSLMMLLRGTERSSKVHVTTKV